MSLNMTYIICVNKVLLLFILEYLSNQSVTKRTSIDCASRRWFHSPDDRPSYTLLNSSSSKYLIQNDNLSLNFSSVSASDEGIYGCIDSGHNRINHICVEVYGECCPHSSYIIIMFTYYVCCIGKAVFASCPHELKCTKNESLTLPANGGSVRFNATVTYIPGGSCGYLQNLTLIKLKKINKTTGKKIKLMCTYRFNEGSCRPNEENSVTLSRGSSGFEFVLTLFNVSADSIGTYEVIVETEHPGAGDKIYLTKRYHVVGK